MLTIRCWPVAILFIYSTSLLPVTDAAVEISAKPAAMSEALTSSLVINCTESTNDSRISDLLTLTLKRSKDDTGNTFEDLATISQYPASAITTLKFISNATVSGNIDYPRTSYLALTIDQPDITAAGQYVCEAGMLDRLGKPDTAVAMVKVTSRPPIAFNTPEINKQIQMLLDRVNNLEKNVGAMKDNNGSTGNGGDPALRSDIDDLKMKYGALQSDVDDIQSNFNASQDQLLRFKSLMFEESGLYNGHTYLLSTFQYLSVGFSEAICEMFGGYLVEIETQDEYDFILKFVKNRSIDIMIGMTDVEKKNEWKYVKSGKIVKYFNRPIYGGEGGSESGETPKHCAYLDEFYDMARQRCSGSSRFKFLCEKNQ